MASDPVAVLREHVSRFNAAVLAGDFAELLDGFAPDAEMVFEGVPVGPFVGREAIAAAYLDRPPDDEVRLLGKPRVHGGVVESDYAWSRDAGRAGRMILTSADGLVARLVVTFE